MTKADLVNVVADKAKLQHRQAEVVVNLVFDLMADALKKDDRIEIRGFGSFVNRSYGSYQGRNPKTGAVVQVAPKRVPFFKVGKELKEMVDVYNYPRPGVTPQPLKDDDDDDDDDNE
ncbi:MAG: integration host factor subunit beta [Deltaproteobacteria bacterium]|nr:integration host factor subunit beta [Deltaproteobacteria bacterium]